MPKSGYVYLLASKPYGTLYVGITSNLIQRIHAHQHDPVEGFTKRYGVHRLVYVEQHADVRDAIVREKQIKKWRRAWKICLIEEHNPQWLDLSDQLDPSF